MKMALKVTLFCVTTFLFSLIILQRVTVAEEQQWQPVLKENYVDVLDLIASKAKANYEKIASWQGRMNILEKSHYYGPKAAEKSYGIYPDSISSSSKHICREGKTAAEFALDMRNDKIYSSVEPNVQYKAVDLNQIIPPEKRRGRPARTRTILTPESYMWYLTDGKFRSKSRKGPPSEMVFVESPQNENVKGFVRDPRIYFHSGGENSKLWDSILKLRNNINDRIKERIAGYPHIEISSLETDKGIKYRILTTWKGGEHYLIKYIRCLLEVDESVGFNALKTETTNPDGVRTDLKEYTYEKIGGVYIPKTIKIEQRNNKGEITIASEITIETTGVNKPLLEDTFTIKGLGVEEGMLVSDKIKNEEFRFSKGKLVPIADPNN